MKNNTINNTLSDQCDSIIAARSLLQHPFYQSWSEGRLPVEALRDYAREYGAFIDTIAAGWRAALEPRIASIEEGHAELWRSTFAASLETEVHTPAIPEAASLVNTAEKLFSTHSTALGALYAFEAQQPQTAERKLKGLREHYVQLPASCGDYFEQHLGDYDEPAHLAEKLNALPPVAHDEALRACDAMCDALYEALSGIHAPHAC